MRHCRESEKRERESTAAEGHSLSGEGEGGDLMLEGIVEEVCFAECPAAGLGPNAHPHRLRHLRVQNRLDQDDAGEEPPQAAAAVHVRRTTNPR